jgi:predicted DNA-binding transcriptional regulator AlpA
VARQTALPSTLPPRLLVLAGAAAYVSVSPNKFLQMIDDGFMPKPVHLGQRRVAWDVRELDSAVDALPRDNAAKISAEHGWSDVNAA